MASSSTSPAPTPSEHRVQLDAYAGPLDLLLYLVKRHEIDLQDIPMAELVEQYLAHLRVIETIDVEKAGEFLVMAATLVEIKSQMLVPHVAADDPDGDGDTPDADPAIDPRFELVQQLLAYKRFKDAAITLESRAAEWEARFPALARAGNPTASAPEETDETHAAPLELDLDDVNLLDLCAAFGRVMDSIGHLGDHEVTYDDTPISLHAEDIVDRIQRDGGPRKAMTLPELFRGRTRSEMIGLFLATLELVRQRKVKVAQAVQPDGAAGEIALELQPESAWEEDGTAEPQGSPDWRDPDTGEVQYEWPDEATRQRAQRRREFRRKWGRDAQAGGDPADSSDTCLSQDEFQDEGEAGANDAEDVHDTGDDRDAKPPLRRPGSD